MWCCNIHINHQFCAVLLYYLFKLYSMMANQ